MPAPIDSTKDDLLNRGYYIPVAQEVVFLLDLSPIALKTLIVIQYLQDRKDFTDRPQEHIARLVKVSVATIERAVRELKSKGLLAVSRASRNAPARYNAAFTTGLSRADVQQQMRELREEGNAVRTLKSEGSNDSRTLKSEGSSYIEETSSTKNLSPDAAASGDEPEAVVIQMPRKHPQPDEFDPTACLDLWEPQEAQEGPSGDLDVLFTAEEVDQPLRSRQKAPSQAQLDSPDGLARWFDSELRKTDWAGPNPVNLAALRKNLSTWKRDGVSPDTIRDMMRRYIADRGMRRPGSAPWSDFVHKRHKLLAALERSNAARAMEEHRYDGAEYWLGGMTDAAKELAKDKPIQVTPGMTGADLLAQMMTEDAA